MIIPVAGLGQLGIVTDLPAQKLALNAWTGGRNVRFREGAVEKFSGHVEVYATPLWAPEWVMPVPYGSSYFWLYASGTKVGATDGLTHADITRAVGGDYNVDFTVGWTGTIIEGIAVINESNNVPQMWNTPSLATKLTSLTGWDSTWRARSLKAMKRYLCAYYITKAAVDYQHMIKWSDVATTGNVPASWDETDETKDAGEYVLPGEGGFLVDAIPLRDDLVVYKEQQTWRQQYVGGIDVFRFDRIFDSIGSVNRRCAWEFFKGKHVVFTGEDVVVHDGQQAQSILRNRALRRILNYIDSTYYYRAFVAINYKKFEVWVCFPETGQSYCTQALVWNWMDDNWSVRDLPNVGHIASGIVSPVLSSSLWSGAVGSWDSASAAWGDRTYNPNARSLLMALPGTTQLMQPDQGNQINGSNMTAYVEKTAIGFPLKIDAPPDFTRMKQINNIWPEIEGTQGGQILVYLGRQSRIGGDVTYGQPKLYTIGTTESLDFSDIESSRMHALKFESTGNIEWRLSEYSVDVVDRGMYYG